MNFFIFFIYLTISIVIYGIIGVVLYKLVIKKKKDDFVLNFDDDFLNKLNADLNKNIDKDFWSDRQDFKVKEVKNNDQVYSSFER